MLSFLSVVAVECAGGAVRKKGKGKAKAKAKAQQQQQQQQAAETQALYQQDGMPIAGAALKFNVSLHTCLCTYLLSIRFLRSTYSR